MQGFHSLVHWLLSAGKPTIFGNPSPKSLRFLSSNKGSVWARPELKEYSLVNLSPQALQ